MKIKPTPYDITPGEGGVQFLVERQAGKGTLGRGTLGEGTRQAL